MKRAAKDGDEVSAFSGERRYLIWRPGERKRAKRRANRRERRQWRQTGTTESTWSDDATGLNE